MKRIPTPFNPDANLDSVLANDIGNNVVESRHLAPSEILEVIEYEIAADASSGVDILGGIALQAIPGKYRIADVKVEARAASASGTMTLRKGTTAITDAMIMAVDKVMVAAGTIDNDESEIDVGDALNVITNGAADRGMVTITVIKQA